MTNAKQTPITCTSGGQNDWPLHSIEVEAELEKLDRQADHDYVPMDLFIDFRTRNEHFRSASIRTRWSGLHQAAT